MSFRVVMDPVLRCDECKKLNGAPLLVCVLPCETHNEDYALCLSCFQDIKGIADFLEPL